MKANADTQFWRDLKNSRQHLTKQQYRTLKGQAVKGNVILEHRTKIDSIGNHKTQWDEAFSCWAAVSVKSSSENADNGTTKEILSLEFTVRQTPDTMRVNPTTHKISFRGLTYGICNNRG